jgi:hypothetical protein
MEEDMMGNSKEAENVKETVHGKMAVNMLEID